MSILNTASSALKTAGKIGIYVIKKAGPFIVAIVPKRFRAVAIGIVAGVPIVNKLLGGEKPVTNEELKQKIREIITKILAISHGHGPMDALVNIGSIMVTIIPLASFFQQPKEVWVPIFRDALDGLVGSEPDCIIGDHDGALVYINPKWVDVELLTDTVISAIERGLLALPAKA